MKHLTKRMASSMDRMDVNNHIKLVGVPAGRPVYSHSSRGQEFFSFPLTVERLSGNTDTLNILIRREQLEALEVEEQGKLCVIGEVRSYNSRRSTGARLVITVLARELRFCDEEDCNQVFLSGTLCKAPNLRSTPMGREICDLMVAVNRHYGRSDYLPCLCWGLSAREAARWSVGTRIHLDGRLQSRNYIKMTEEGPVEKTAFEISAISIERTEEAS